MILTEANAAKAGKVEEFDITDLQPWSDDDGKGGSGSGAGDEDEMPSAEDVAAEEARARGRGSKSKDIASEKEAGDEEGKSAKSSSSGGSSKARKDGPPSQFDYTKVKPRMSWRALLAKLVKNSSGYEEPTYTKPAKRSITGANIAVQTGSSAIKPADKFVEQSTLKLAFVIDSSGSMSGAIAEVYANINNLLKNRGAGVDSEFVLIKFSNDFKTYVCKLSSGGRGSFKEVSSISGVKKSDLKNMETGDLNKLFSEHFGNSTNFNGPLIAELEYLLAHSYNILILTDTDIVTDGKNRENFKQLYQKAKQQVYLIADSQASFASICQALKEIGHNITHM